jgi:hypothetical protein
MFECHEHHGHHSAQSGPLGTPVANKITDLLNINKVHINIYWANCATLHWERWRLRCVQFEWQLHKRRQTEGWLFRLILERDVWVANHAICFPVPGLYSPLGLCFYYYRYFSLLKKLLLIQIFLSVNTVAIAPFHS